MGTTKMQRSGVLPSVIALALAGAVLTSCSSAQPQGSPSQPPATTSPTATTSVPGSPSTAPTREETATRIGEGYVPFGHFLVKPNSSERRAWVEGPTEFFVIGTGPLRVSAGTLLPGSQIASESYTSIGTEASPMIAGLVEYRAPASGLDPEKFVTLLVALDPSKGQILKQTEISSVAQKGAISNLTGSANGTAAAFTSTEPWPSKTVTTAAIDVMTGQKLWQRKGFSQASIFGALTVLEDGNGIDGGGSACQRAVGTDLATGKALYTVESLDLDPSTCDMTIISGGKTGLSEYLLYTRITAADGKDVAFNSVTGAPVSLPKNLLAADPRTSLVVGNPGGGISDAKPIIVSDATTGAAKFTLEATRAGSLHAQVQALHAGRLYLKTTDQQPVVDIATGQTITNNARRYPLGAVDSWTYWSDGKLEKTS